MTNATPAQVPDLSFAPATSPSPILREDGGSNEGAPPADALLPPLSPALYRAPSLGQQAAMALPSDLQEIALQVRCGGLVSPHTG